MNLGWLLKSTAVVERPPIVLPDMPDWKREFLEIQASLEYYKLRDYPPGIGVPHPSEPDEDDMVSDQNEDSDGEQVMKYEPAPRVTQADEDNDLRSMERALPESLYLVVKQKSTGTWAFPQTTVKEDEMLGKAAQRAIDETCSELPELFHFHRQPFGFIPIAFDEPTQQQLGAYGAKLFFYNAQVVNPYEKWAPHVGDGNKEDFNMQGVTLRPDGDYDEMAWLTKAELSERMRDPSAPDLPEYLLGMLD